MAIRLPSHLHRARSGMLHFRIAIPPDLQRHFTIREIYRSLRTASVREAAPVAQTLSQTVKHVFHQLRSGTMSDQKNPPIDPFDGFELGLITEISLDEFMRPKLTLVAEPQDTPEDRIQAQVKFLRAAGIASAAGQIAAAPMQIKPGPLLSELVEDYKRDRLAANKWTSKTQDENLAVYKLCIDIIGDLPINEIGDDQALTYVETVKRLPPNMNKMPAYRGKTISEIIALNPEPMAKPVVVNKDVASSHAACFSASA